MSINPITIGSHSDPLVLSKRSESAESKTTSLEDLLPGLTTATGTSADALREILQEYDVTEITPREFSEMLQKLHKAGAISDSLFEELGLVRLDLERDGIDPDESVNLVEYYSEKLAKVRRDDWSASLFKSQEDTPEATLASRLEWMEKFALINSGPAAVGLDTTA